MNSPISRSDRGASRLTRPGPVLAAIALLGTAVAAGVLGGFGGDGSGSAPPTSPPGASTTVASTTTLPPTTTTIALERTLAYGATGADVKRLQERLTALKFNPGPIDGQFGALTQAAVWAYEKLVLDVPRAEATGKMTPRMWKRLQEPIRIRARRPDAGKHTEIYLPEQVLVAFDGNKPLFVSHISTGDGEEWVQEVTISPGEYGNETGTEPLTRMEKGLSLTPGGVFEYYRMVKGRRLSALGGMLNPVYFNYGIAVHGAFEVPLYPASHGCIRIPNSISGRFQRLVEKGQTVFVWDGEKEPEAYGAQVPPFNTVLTTTTTSTIAPPPPPTTTIPITTPPPATTTTPPATTTTSTTTTTTSPVPATSEPRGSTVSAP